MFPQESAIRYSMINLHFSHLYLLLINNSAGQEKKGKTKQKQKLFYYKKSEPAACVLYIITIFSLRDVFYFFCTSDSAWITVQSNTTSQRPTFLIGQLLSAKAQNDAAWQFTP